ncbi:hypothetical protein [Actinomadura madurae]|uniref:hypothetical protein n=1 Tax=Actinomadura madurae TaxID=1993 RepID=UPI003FD8EECD
MTVSGRSVAENLADAPPADPAVIRPVDDPVAPHGGLLVMTGNLFESAVMKTSVITDEFRARYLPPPGRPQAFDLRAIVFDGPEDYHARIEDPGLDIDEHCILVIRYTGPIGYPGSAEVVNMELPTGLAQRGVIALPTLGDGPAERHLGRPIHPQRQPRGRGGRQPRRPAHRRPDPRRPGRRAR